MPHLASTCKLLGLMQQVAIFSTELTQKNSFRSQKLEIDFWS